MKRISGLVSLFVFALALAAWAADTKLTGTIGDKMCGTKHMMEGGEAKCTLACVDKGSKFVLIQGNKVIDIENQDAKGLRENAGNRVTVTGAVSSDAKSVRISALKAAK